MVAFPSIEWFDKAREALADALPRREGFDGRIQFEAETETGDERLKWVQEFADGQIGRWELGEMDSPDVTVSWRLADALPIMRGDLVGTKALWATTIIENRKSGCYVGPLPPMDMGGRPELDELPYVPNASVTLQYYCHSSPLGTVATALKFLDGQLVAVMTDAPKPDVTAHISFRSLLRHRRGEIGLLDCLDGGHVSGEQGAMILLAGIMESRPYEKVNDACASPSLALATLGELLPEYRTLVQRLA